MYKVIVQGTGFDDKTCNSNAWMGSYSSQNLYWLINSLLDKFFNPFY